MGKKGEPYDLALETWGADYFDPANFLEPLLAGKAIHQAPNYNYGFFDDPVYNRRLESAARLAGSRRYRAYARLDADMARKRASLVALYNWTELDFFSARMGCQVYQPNYGMDIAALCIRK